MSIPKMLADLLNTSLVRSRNRRRAIKGLESKVERLERALEDASEAKRRARARMRLTIAWFRECLTRAESERDIAQQRFAQLESVVVTMLGGGAEGHERLAAMLGGGAEASVRR